MSCIRLLALLLLISVMSASVSGCGFKDIDKRFFVVMMGIDRADGGAKGYKITLRLAIPSPKIEPGAGKSLVQTIQATSIAEAVRLMKSHVDKEIDFGHCKLFVVGEQLARNNYTDILRWLSRRRDVQSVAYMAIGKPDAKTILNVMPTTERYPGNTIFLMYGKDGTQSSYLITVYLFDFIRRFQERGMDPILPVMREEHDGYVVTRLALLDKSKLVTVLSPAETETYNQVRNKFTKSTVTAVKDGITMVISVDRITSNYRIVKEEDGYVLKLKFNVSGIFEEAPIGIYNEDWNAIEALFDKQVGDEVLKLLKKVQQSGVDPFGFGLHYRATHAGNAQTWADWERIYPKLKFEVTTHVKIEGSGLIR
ncbi:Ger(x)C family spore germination protein [Paenibacillus sp. R14(2021)]|uniref:Ger(x)C family spore germination protein n=1 Tax=Paenibacillus sp. R14(2021) TaxID=2859228 RepID=UPI001C612ED1|nr:Ger(x)C family spore germination protein [Paenibacillus sp. R14(2021)]